MISNIAFVVLGVLCIGLGWSLRRRGKRRFGVAWIIAGMSWPMGAIGNGVGDILRSDKATTAFLALRIVAMLWVAIEAVLDVRDSQLPGVSASTDQL